MEHSKLPWKYCNYGTFVTAVDIGGCEMKASEFPVCQMRGWGHLQYHGDEKGAGIQEANANFIVKACNEHDTLKAKANMLDNEIIAYFQDNCEQCKHESISKYGKHGKEGCKSCWSGKLLRKAKELK